MKAILVKSCYECPYREYFDKGVICMQMGLTWTDKMDGYFPDWCPLKPLPSFQKYRHSSGGFTRGFTKGWNTCLKEIGADDESNISN